MKIRYAVIARHYTGSYKTLQEAEDAIHMFIRLELEHGCHPREKFVDLIRVIEIEGKRPPIAYSHEQIVKRVHFF